MAISTKGSALIWNRTHWVRDEQPAPTKEPQWVVQRNGNYRHWVGMNGAKGFAIHPRQFGVYLHRSKPWPATNFGPFDSVEAAKAAFVIMKDIN